MKSIKKRTKILCSLILLLGCLVLLTNSKCAKGCLRCNEQQECLYCDVSTGYHLNSYKNCVLNLVENCTVMTQEGVCIQCKDLHYLDTLKNLCIEVPLLNKIEKCLRYSDLFTCVKCEQFYYVENNSCVEVPKNIVNCTHFEVDNYSVCLECAENFVLNHDGSECLPIIPIESCSGYTIQSCDKCRDGWTSNESSYLMPFIEMNNPNAFNVFNRFLIAVNENIIDNLNYPKCEILFVSNCLIPKNVYECEICYEGYYLGSDHSCYPDPEEAVDFCIKYEKKMHCIECQQGYYPHSSDQCLQIPKIDNCEVYSQTSEKCQTCKSAFFLNGDKCDQRNLSLHVELCTNRDPNSDTCIECQSGFHPTSDGLKCLNLIPNCITYEISDKDSQFLKCNICKEGFFYNDEDNYCVFPSVADHGCKIFERDSFKCSVCQEGFYLDSQGTCFKHNLDYLSQACNEPSQNIPNGCNKCEEGYTLFPTKNTCQVVTSPISNCLIYKTQQDCFECEDNFYAPQCQPIPESANCIQYNYLETTCKKCKDGYYIDSQGKCLKPGSLVEVGCETIELNNADEFSCVACQTGFIFRDWSSTFTCFESNDFIENCQAYTPDQTQALGYKCERCIEGYVLDMGSNSCRLDCPNSRPLLIKQLLDSNFKVTNINVCSENDDLDNCRVASFPQFDVANAGLLDCIKCETNNFPYMDLSSGILYQTYHSFNISGLVTDIIINPISKANFIKCENESELETKNLTSSALPSTGCALYAIVGDKYLCVKCQHGMSGIVKNFAELETDPPLYGINSCVAIPDCILEITSYDGFGWHPNSSNFKVAMQTLMTCVSCNNGKLPFLQFSESSSTTIGKYDLIQNIPIEGNQEGMSVTCKDIYTEIQSIQDTDGNQVHTFPSNCSMGAWLIDRDKTTDVKSFLCMACKPGFKGTYSAEAGFEYSITSCDPIENCDPLKGGRWHSSCSQCSKGYFWQVSDWGSQKMIDYSVCKSSSANTECLIVNSSGECVTCKEQAFKNQDGECENIYMNSCSESYRFEWFNHSTYPHFLATILAPKGDGCMSCGEGQNAINQIPDNLPCSRSDYVLSNNFPTSTAFIFNCINYGYDLGNNSNMCKKCSSDYRLNLAETKCILKSISPGCEVYENDESTCRECEESYSLFNGNCLVNDIQNCIEYSIESGNVICKRCQDEYYLTNKSCQKGKVDNCKEYFTNGDPLGCQSCKDSYALFYTSLGNALCLSYNKNDQITNCKKWDTLANSKEYYCEECEIGYTRTENISLLEYPANICIGPVKIVNCLIYDINSEPKNSTYLCSQCVSGYFVNSGVCQKRSSIPNCTEFFIDQDKCSLCSEGYYLSENGDSCISFPLGIQGCIIYESSNKCSLCKEGYYISQERCKIVPDEKKVPFCEKYSSEIECQVCKSGFFLSKKKCEKANVPGCIEYLDEENCKKCDSLYGLSMEDGKSRCILKNVSNCKTSTKYFPFKCLTCLNNYYPLHGYCKPVETVIDFCTEYSHKDRCQTCDTQSTLSYDRKKCLKNLDLIKSVDSGCEKNRIVKPFCNICMPGHYLQENTCKKCENNGSLEEGCNFCNPRTPTECIMCSSGYYFSPLTKNCIKVNDDDDGNFAKIMNNWILIFFILLLIKNY